MGGGGRRHFLSKSMREKKVTRGDADGKNLIDVVRAGNSVRLNDTTAARLRMDGSPILALLSHRICTTSMIAPRAIFGQNDGNGEIGTSWQ